MSYKIGILTYHNANNFGAVLQAFALQEVLKKIDKQCIPEIINYSCPAVTKTRTMRGLISQQGIIKGILHYPFTSKRIRNIDTFLREKATLSEPVSRDHLAALAKDYALIISGSDQVWNRRWNGGDLTYLQDFNENSKTKASYAVSFGTSQISAEEMDTYKKMLADFSKISVREESAASLIRSIGLEASVNIDPTLLLSAEDWYAEAVSAKVNNKYILVYMVPYQKNILDFAKKYAQNRGLEVVVVSRSIRSEKSIINKGDASVPQLLDLFNKAELVCTNSFHGTAFAVINHKDIIISFNNVRGRNERSESLLKSLGIIHDRTDLKKDILILDGIDWNNVDSILELEKRNSYSYLSSLLQNAPRW